MILSTRDDATFTDVDVQHIIPTRSLLDETPETETPKEVRDSSNETDEGGDGGNGGVASSNYPSTTNPAPTKTPGSTVPTTTSTTPATAAAAGTPTSPTPAATPAAANAACSLTIANAVQSYTMCYTLRIGSNFKVYYTLESDPSDATSSILSMAMQGTSSGWIGVGFPSRAGQMTNAAAAILRACATCPTGAAINQYYMTGTEQSNVNVDTRLDMTEMTASGSNGVISGSWKMKLPGIAATSSRRRRLLQLNFPANSFNLIYANGPISAAGDILEHKLSQSSTGNVDLLKGVPTTGDTGSGTNGTTPGDGTGDGTSDSGEVVESDTETLKNVHMWFAAVSWGFLIPVAILMPRYFKPHTTWWFNFHRGLAVLGFLMGVATLVLGFEANGGWETDLPVHRNLGLTCTILGFLQMFSLINWLRPTKDHKYRPYWFFVHVWFGRSAAVIGIANIYYGIINVEELGTWAWATYTGVLGAIVLVAVIMEVVNWRLHKQVKDEKQWNMMQSPSRPAFMHQSTN